MKVFEILSTVPYPGYKGKGSDFRAYDEPDMPKMHTQPRNYAIIINGKPWKVVRNLNHARSIENTLKSKGKEVEVKITDEPVSEVSETTTASSVATVVGNIGTTHSRNMYNTDGTMKNGLNFGNLLGGNKKPDKKKKTKKNT